MQDNVKIPVGQIKTSFDSLQYGKRAGPGARDYPFLDPTKPIKKMDAMADLQCLIRRAITSPRQV